MKCSDIVVTYSRYHLKKYTPSQVTLTCDPPSLYTLSLHTPLVHLKECEKIFHQALEIHHQVGDTPLQLPGGEDGRTRPLNNQWPLPLPSAPDGRVMFTLNNPTTCPSGSLGSRDPFPLKRGKFCARSVKLLKPSSSSCEYTYTERLDRQWIIAHVIRPLDKHNK